MSTDGGSVGVLTVDDQEFFLVAAREVIDATPGFHYVAEASSGPEALDLLDGGVDAQLALVDVRMPGIDGVECARRMRQAHPGVAVVLISASDYPEGDVVVRKQDFGPTMLRRLWEQHGEPPHGRPEKV